MIRINVASPDELLKLYSIGPELAKRIVESRERDGPYRHPEDLSRVMGISLDLALTLSPHIDWSVSEAVDTSSEERSYSSALLSGAFSLALIWFSMRTGSVLVSWLAIPERTAQVWVCIWINASLLAFFCIMNIGVIAFFVLDLSKDSERVARLWRMQVICWAVSLIFVASTGLGNAVYYHLYAPSRWNDLIADSAALGGLMGGVLGFFIIVPLFLTLVYPKVSQKPWARRSFDTALIIMAPVSGFCTWANANRFPIILIIFNGLTGILLTAMAIDTLRTGRSFFYVIIDNPLTSSMSLKQHVPDVWKAWLNARLPDPEEQKALKRSLDEAYPPSRLRTIGGVIVLGAGGWLLLTACGGVVEWLVQKWLENLTRP